MIPSLTGFADIAAEATRSVAQAIQSLGTLGLLAGAVILGCYIHYLVVVAPNLEGGDDDA